MNLEVALAPEKLSVISFPALQDPNLVENPE
jgi:hypothetical protein